MRKDGTLPWLRPDGKTQVSVRYRDGRPIAVEKVLISTQHDEGVEDRIPDALWEEVVTAALPAELYDPAELRKNYYVNPTGRFVIGGPVGDCGLTGRKIIVDTYGGSPGTVVARSWPRTSSPPGSPTAARCRWPTPSAWRARSR